MITPIKKNLQIHKGADFNLKLRFKSDGVYSDLTDCIVRFNASSNGANVYSLVSGDSPETITIDEGNNFLVTISITDTAAITQSELFYTIDLEDALGVNGRWMYGTIQVYEGAE